MSNGGWREVVLGDVIEFVSKKIKVSELSLDNYISTENMMPDLGGISVSSGLPSATTARSYIENDVLFSNIRTYFKKVWFADRDGGCSNDVLVFRSSGKLAPKFLYSILSGQDFIDYTVATAKGTKMPRGDRDAIEQYKFKLPPLPTQKAIAKILGDLDAKIELNRKMNESLEAMAQALFQSWFVDFDPVLDNFLVKNGGNVEALPEPLRKKGGLRLAVTKKNTPEINELFPDSFVFNEVLEKWIPVGWGVKPLKDITVELRRGVSPKYIEDGGIRVLNQKCIRNHIVNYSLARRNDPTKRKTEGRLLEIGDIVINSTGTGTLGRIATILSLDEPTIVDSHVTVVRGNKSILETSFFQYLMFSIEDYIEAMGEGSTGQTELSRLRLSEVEVLVPPKSGQCLIENSLSNFNSKKDSNNILSGKLTKLRDTLLPQLISGKLSVPDAMLEVEKEIN